jgi:hypothetical protein
MPTKLLNLIPARRRNKLFNEIRFLINEVDAQDRSLEFCGEGMAVDESLEEICGLLSRESKRVKKTRKVAVAA